MNDQSDVVKIAQVFNNGRSRAIRIPKEFEFEEESVEIRKADNGDLIIHPVRKKSLLEVLHELEELDDAVCTSIVVVCELKFGAARRGSAKLTANLTKVLETIAIEDFKAPADAAYAELRAALEKAGTPIGLMDMMIAAHALVLDATVVTANEREFSRVPGLRVENWMK